MSLLLKRNQLSVWGVLFSIFAFLSPLESFLETSAGSLLKFYAVGLIVLIAVYLFLKGSVKRRAILVPLAIYLVFTGISLLWSASVEKGADALAAIGLQVILIFMASQLNFSSTDKNYMIMGYIASALIVSALVFANRSIISTVERATVTTNSGGLDPNNIAAFIVCGFSLLLYFPFESIIGKILKLFGCAVMIMAVLYTVSRAGAIGLIVSVLLFLLSQRKLKRIIIAIAGVTIIALYSYAIIRFSGFDPLVMLRSRFVADYTGSYRTELWKVAISEIMKHPLFGCGIGESPSIIYAKTYYKLGSHNTFLTIWMESGIFAFGGLTVFLWSLFRKKDKNSRFSLSSYSMLFSGLIASLFNDMYNKKILWLPILFCVISICSPKIERRRDFGYQLKAELVYDGEEKYEVT